MAAPDRKKEIQISILVDPRKPFAILRDAKRLYRTAYPEADFRPVDRAFRLTKRLYEGGFPGYLACAVDYHDFGHSASVFAATSRLLDGCELSGFVLGPTLAGELLIAAMLHDTGYIRAEGDTSGTGAQYTKIHVDRSSAFVLREREAFGLDPQSAARISRMILGTDLERPWEGLVFASGKERIAAEILATADLFGQMADRAYLEKLLFLYYEFREAGIGGYDSAYDILTKTAGFYKSIQKRLDGTLGRVSGRMKAHFEARYAVPRDLYRETIARQMAYLDAIIADDSTNFREKLRRMDLGAIERRGSHPPSNGS
ncbi:MAG: HD domain-containing protein [Syntrophales bacterium]|nr:HD domain-containing protein [Syntrophales bacterium]MDD4340234.1 HD domain-containing protein [Syntrophales bacterium]HOG06966.1 HD domain-containing protein [Syntrophales bacterium]HOS77240.1 HD domain-containing protein [Syntrophales bacterium]HQN26597.1 HD domain-containing protein [Syntrophales bacterium]